MNKGFKIFLGVLVLISVGFSLAIIFDFNSLIKKKIGPSQTPTPALEDWRNLKSTIASPSSNLTFPSPVDEKYLATADFISVSYSGNNIYMLFFLEPEAEIKSIFNGVVLEVDHFKKGDQTFPQPNEESDFSQIWIQEENKNFIANYVFIGDVFVEKDDNIEAGEVLIRAKEGKLTSRKNSNFTLAIFDKEGNKIMLSKDLFLKN